MNERNKDVIVTNGSGGAGWFVAAILAAIVAIGAYAYRDAIFGGGTKDVNISIEVPKIE